MHLIDTHTHLFLEHFESDIDQVIKGAEEQHINHFILPNVDLDTIDDLMAVCRKYSKCYPAIGLHPTSVKMNWESDLNRIIELIDNTAQIVGIGEIGIDLYWDKTFIEEQKKVFKIQLLKAHELGLPVIIHARDSFLQIYDVLDSLGNQIPTGVFHSFTGTSEDVKKIMSYESFVFGINGIVTFKNSTLPEVIDLIPKEKLILETDSPYLAPHPNRGKRNESKYLIYIAKKIAEIWGYDLKKVAEITTANAKNLFNLS